MTAPANDEVYWPGVLREVRDRFGLAMALQLAGACGGRTWTMPKRAGRTHEIARATSVDVLAWLIAEYRGGNKVTIPLGPLSGYRKRIMLIRRLIDQRAPTAQIIAAAECHERTVRRHRNRDRRPAAEPRQRVLF